MYFNKTCMTYSEFCKTQNLDSIGQNCVNATGSNVTVNGLNFDFKTPSEDFWNINILGLNTTGPDHVVNTWSEWGDINLPLLATLALAWGIICATLIKGSDA